MEMVAFYLAIAAAAIGLLEFGVGALLWGEQKAVVAIGLIAALCGLYLGVMVVFLLVSPFLG